MSTPADDARVIELLWRHYRPERPPQRGPKPGMTVDDVVLAGIRIADRDGIAKLSMRTVAAELGMRPMSLYTYVPSKEALLTLMVDHLATEDDPLPTGTQALIAIATQVRAELIAHPWLLEITPWRHVLGPGRTGRYDRQLAALAELTDLDDLAADRAIAILTDFATGNARLAVGRARASEELSDADWWATNGPLLAELVPADAFPLAARVGARAGEHYGAPADPDGAFVYGAQLLADGILANT
ncbi:TetR/AcrR family transcriptional regulator [Nocardia camponoti]|uniref:TetR family transcriptional regulator n=1 Tax=Nocardia camponoti TaxID=1616106 RepID=A0A917QBP0_9NOCA|nr:TetR/AcrR family transcriptional regulator C-terminal domain-containing protein [Nocardia camponoti]GGK41140.1 TetR family transcriptional regulator [Nocardia camponoti]